VVGWYARSDNANRFVVYRLDGQGNPQEVYEIAAYTDAGGGEPYSWTDTDTDQSGQWLSRDLRQQLDVRSCPGPSLRGQGG
jgi:hypothetical protein